MRLEDFSDQRSGRLEPTEFQEEYLEDGIRHQCMTKGSGFVPNPLPPSLDLGDTLVAIHEELMSAERNLSLLEGLSSLLKNPHLLIKPFANREAKYSSAIEATFASGKQLALFELDPSAIDDKDRDEVREVRNYVKALEHGLASNMPICLRLIREMHEILLGGIKRKAGIPGEFRKTQNAIGRPGTRFKDARFVPPPPSCLQSCLGELEQFINKKSPWPRLVKFAMIHCQFETIHPFDDGNGRLGRLMIAMQLCEQAQLSKPLVYVSGYFEKHRQEYYDKLLAVSTQGEWVEWVKFFLIAVATQAHDALDLSKRLVALRNEYHIKVRTKRSSALLPHIVDRLFEMPSITIADAAARTKSTPNAASAAISKLVEYGILIEATGRKKDRIYIAPEIIRNIYDED